MLAMFIGVGALLGGLAWYAWMKFATQPSPRLESSYEPKTQTQQHFDHSTGETPLQTNVPPPGQMKAEDLPSISEALPIPEIKQSPSRIRDAALIRQVNILATRLVDFADERDALTEKFTENYWSAAKKGQLPPLSPEDRMKDLEESLKSFKEEAASRANQLYWPAVLKLTEEMAASGIDISSISRISASGGARLVGLRLSALATHIGKTPPFDRTLTPLMARAVVKNLPPANFEISAFGRDSNSVVIAENLREAMLKEGWDVPEVQLFYPTSFPIYRGIKVIYPYEDMASMDDIRPALQSCGLDAATSVLEKFPPNALPIKPGMPWGKIEVWPTPLTK